MAVKLQTIKEIRNYFTRELEGIYDSSEIKSIIDIVFSSVLNKGRLDLLMEPEMSLSPEKTGELTKICAELKTGKPVQYIIGETVFYDCIIKVDKNVLIPRPETEELVHHVIKENNGFTGNILDLCTGSGCIAVALAVNLPGARVTAVDNSEQVLMKAAENAKLNSVEIDFLKVDILYPLFAMPYIADIIVSNPPYVLNSQKLQMHKNVLDFEPHEALFVPDDDPMKFYRAILVVAENILSQGGRIYFEINETMGKVLHELMESFDYSNVEILKDINGKERIMKGKKNDRKTT